MAAEIGAPLVFVEQVHSADVLVLPALDAGPGHGPGPAGEPGPVVRADAIVTDRTDVALAIMVADCLPVLLSDPVAGVVAVPTQAAAACWTACSRRPSRRWPPSPPAPRT